MMTDRRYGGPESFCGGRPVRIRPMTTTDVRHYRESGHSGDESIWQIIHIVRSQIGQPVEISADIFLSNEVVKEGSDSHFPD